MSISFAVALATGLLIAIIFLVKMFDADIRKSKAKKQGIILMFALCIGLYLYAFSKMIGGF